jgi:cytoskeleton protein RodZ
MATVGEILRRERERQGLSIAHIAQQTRIRRQFLEALEKDDFSTLPGVFFARAFTIQYAQFLGLNTDEVQVALERQVAPPTLNLVQISSSLYLADGKDDASKPALDPLPEGTASAMSARKLTASVIALASVIIGCGTVFWLWQRSQIGLTSANATPDSAGVTVIKGGAAPISPPPVQPSNAGAKVDAPSGGVAAGGVPAAGLSASGVTASGVSGPNGQAAQPGQQVGGQVAPGQADPARTVSGQPASAAQTPVAAGTSPGSVSAGAPPSLATGGQATAAPLVPGKVNLSIVSKEDTWVRITTDGKVILARVIAPGEPLVTAVANESAKILLGNAGGVTIRFNGNDIGVVGPRGQVRTVEFTPAGFNVIQPPPKTPPGEDAATPKPPNPGA